MSTISEVRQKAKMAKEAASRLVRLTTAQKNEALLRMADALVTHQNEIIKANEEDLRRGKESGLRTALLDRLALNEERIAAMAEGLRQIADLPDPIGETLECIERPNGLRIEKRRVPLGLIGIIYEARPNVTVDAAGLCLKSGNAVAVARRFLRPVFQHRIVEVLHSALAQTAYPADALQLIENTDRSSVDEMLKLNGLLDVVIPRGGASLIQNVVQNATVPVIETGAGICHTYIDDEADAEMAFAIAINAKVQRPSVCNAMETLLVHERFASKHLAELVEQFRSANVLVRGCRGQERSWMDWKKQRTRILLRNTTITCSTSRWSLIWTKRSRISAVSERCILNVS